MALTFPGQVLLVDGIQTRRLISLPPLTVTLESGVTPYIKHNDTPKFTWVCSGVIGSGLITYRIQITWVGNGQIVPLTEIDETGLTSASYAVPYFKKLKHTSDHDAGGEYQVIVTASQQGSSSVQIGGRFRVNFVPSAPINLVVT